MRCQLIILLAICSDIVKAGPIRSRRSRLGRDLFPRLDNSTEAASAANIETSEPSSIVSVHTFSEAATPTLVNPSTSAASYEPEETSSIRDQLGNEVAASVDVGTETIGSSAALQIPSVTPTKTGPTIAISPLSESSIPVSLPQTSSANTVSSASGKASQITDAVKENIEDNRSAVSTTSESLSYPAETTVQDVVVGKVETSSSTAASTPSNALQKSRLIVPETTSLQLPPTEAEPMVDSSSKASEISVTNVHDAFDAFQRARSTQATTTQSPTSTSNTVNQLVTGTLGSSSTVPAVTATQTATLSSELPSEPFRTVPTESLLPSSAQPLSTISAQALALSERMSTSARTNTISFTTPSVLSSIIQVPSSLLGNPNRSTGVPNVEPSHPSNGPEPVNRAYPDSSEGYAAMAQGYNKIFQSLDMSSRCDPKESKQASACVNGLPAKCEMDGTYTLISCSKGKSCYAVPYLDGNGMDVDCYTPADANRMVTAGLAGGSSQTQTTQNAPSAVILSAVASVSPSSSFSDLFGTAVETLATSTPVSTPAVPSSRGDVFTRAALYDNGLSTPAEGFPATSVPQRTQVITGSSASFLQTAVSSSSSPSFTGFPTPVATVENVPDDPAVSTPAPIFRASDEQSGDPARHGKSPSSSKQGPERQQPAPVENSPAKHDATASGVRLSFPGSKDSEAGSRDANPAKSSKDDDSSDEAPPVSSKNVISVNDQSREQEASSAPSALVPENALAAHVDISSTPALTTFSTITSSRPDITVAPILGAGHQGFITVTVTQTTTVHHRS